MDPTALSIPTKGWEAFPTRSPNDRLVPATAESRPNKSDLIESLLNETALNTREINSADPCARGAGARARHAIADWLEGIAFKVAFRGPSILRFGTID